jgi:fibronectin-binding autotransporter adhesin
VAGSLNVYSVTGGTNIVGGIAFGSGSGAGTVNFTNGAVMYVGSQGIVSNGAVILSAVLNGGSLLGATADWTGSAAMQLSAGTETIQAADLNGTAHNITISGVLSGPGALTKTGNGSLTLNGTNAHTGAIAINAGTLAVGANGAISTSSQIGVSGGATFDVTAKTGYTLGSAQFLVGDGTVVGNVIAAPGATISAGTSAIGKLTFANDLSETNANHTFELSATTNDSINVVGTLNLNGTNLLTFVGIGNVPTGFYKLFSYGSLVGDVTNLSFSGAGYLTNNTANKTISLFTPGVRGATNIVWVGGSPNNWDVLTSQNWKRQSDNGPEYYSQGDTVLFNAAGAANPIVNIVSSMQPNSVTVDAAANYTFSGAGGLIGTLSLTKTNTGTLTVLTTNTYSGVTTISGGTLEAATIDNANAPSSIGLPGNTTSGMLVLDGGALRYLGGTVSSDRGATLNAGGGKIDVTNSATTLTFGGTVTGSGALTKAGPGTLIIPAANNYSGGTVISNGVLQINANNGAGSAAITNEGGILRVIGTLTVDNIMQFDGACAIEVNGAGTGNVPLRGAWSGGGTVNVNFITQNASQTFSIGGEGAGGGNMANFYGTVNFGTNSGFVRLNNNATFNLGSSNATFNLGTGTVSFSQRNGPSTTYLGALAGGSNTKLTGSRSDTHGLETYEIGGNNLSTTFNGVITNGTQANDITAITKVGTGVLTLGGTNYYTGATIINGGTIALSGVGCITRSPTISLFTNTVIDSSARTDGALNLNSGQTLQGSGAVKGSVVVSGGAFLTVGDVANFPDLMVITNALTLQANSTLNMDVDHYQYYGGLTNDVIKGLASVTYGGTLNLNVLSVETNSVFKLFSAGSYAGAFASISPTLPPLSPPIWAWDTSKLTVDGTLRVARLSPRISGVDFSTLSGGSITLNAINGLPGGSVNVLTSTNLTLPLSSWTTNATTTFDGSGNLTGFGITVDPALPQSYFILRMN